MQAGSKRSSSATIRTARRAGFPLIRRTRPFASKAAERSVSRGPIPLREAVQKLGQSHDLSQLTSLGVRGGRMMARFDENGALQTYQVSAQGVTELPRNWPRMLHEGNWWSVTGSILNVITSLALM